MRLQRNTQERQRGGAMIEIMRGKDRIVYRISPDNACVIERRINQHGARWCFYKVADSAADAKRALLALQEDKETTP